MSIHPKAGPLLQSILNHPAANRFVDVSIGLKLKPATLVPQHPDASKLADHSRLEAIRQIEKKIIESQQNIVDQITDDAQGPIRRIWINNVVGATLPIDAILLLLQRDDVSRIEVNQKLPAKVFLDHKPTQKEPVARKKRHNKPTAKSSSTPGITAAVEKNLEQIAAPEMWKLNLTGKGVLVAILDTGIFYDHPDFAGRMWDGGPTYPHHGWNSVFNTNDPKDQAGHGTCCAGITAGLRTGVAYDATLMAVKVLHVATGTDPDLNSEQAIWDGIGFAVKNGCRLISMSLSMKHINSPNYPEWRTQTESCYSFNVLHINSSGRQGTDASETPTKGGIPNNMPAPASCPPPWLSDQQKIVGKLSSVIACGNCNMLDKVLDYSGVGPSDWSVAPWDDYPYTDPESGLLKPDLIAPGIGIKTCKIFDPTKPIDEYTNNPFSLSFSGTSAATPHVAGAIALIMQHCIDTGLDVMPIAQIHQALSQSCDPVPTINNAGELENGLGSGRINVYNAYKLGVAEGWW